MPNIEAALWYLKKGYSVIPVKKNKQPFIKWQPYQEEIATPKQLNEWWGKWPNANIGIVTGKISGVTVFDADSEKGKEALQEFISDSIDVPTVKTPNGWHYYFKYSKDVKNGVRVLTDCDIRNDGGYVVAPPSSNGSGAQYDWLKDLHIGKIKPPNISSILLDVLQQYGTDIASIYNTNINTSYIYKGERNIACNNSVTSRNILSKGRRDNDIFHLANCLVKGGMPEKEVAIYLKYIAKTCDPPFDEKDVDIKVLSAVKRSGGRDKITTQRIREWIDVTSGNFSLEMLYHSVTIVTSDAKTKTRVILGRLVNEGIIERVGKIDGWYRKIDDQSEKIDITKLDYSEFPVKLPLNLHDLFIPQPKNIIVVAGERDAGKSCFCLNVACQNVNRGFPINYFTSEMGGAELAFRLKKFEPDVPFDHWLNVEFKSLIDNFHDSIDPDGLNIIDYLKLDTDFYLIGGLIRKIFKKLNKGVAVIAMQKNTDKNYAVGGEGTKDEARLYVTLSSNPPEGGIARIEKAKNWRNPGRNPNYLECVYRIRDGAHMRQVVDWGLPSKYRKEEN